ncbi:MAG: cation diffusion facilitator family transporter [Carboxylicivirga sp.]|jgi:cobalt-zinc-cadmium efflux system protein|nr:cation diffusion facilitator family transporter [Carboxylicivirga sp.]
MKHSHHADHHHRQDLNGRKLLWVTLLNFSITIVQVVGGLVSNSLSLLSDALHNLGDSSAIFIAFLAGKRSRKQADKQHTFGYKRIEILAAFFNGIVLIAICLYLFIEAYERFIDPQPIRGGIMLLVASFGLLANLLSVLVLNKDKDENLNIKAAYMHLLGDTLSSVAVIIGGLAIWKFNIVWIDPLITILVGIYIIYHTWGIVRQTIDILMQAAPDHLNLTEVKKAIESIKLVDNIHHIHAWKLDDSQVHFEAHINLKENMDMLKLMEVRLEIENLLQHQFEVNHITLQMGYDCCNGNNELINKQHS